MKIAKRQNINKNPKVALAAVTAGVRQKQIGWEGGALSCLLIIVSRAHVSLWPQPFLALLATERRFNWLQQVTGRNLLSAENYRLKNSDVSVERERCARGGDAGGDGGCERCEFCRQKIHTWMLTSRQLVSV